MGLREQSIIDTAYITGNLNDWGAVITMTAPNGESVVVTGLHNKHHLDVDTEGNIINSKKASVSISETNILLINPNYPIRNIKNEVDLNRHKVTVADSTGLQCNYILQGWYPDEVLGLIVCILEDYA